MTKSWLRSYSSYLGIGLKSVSMVVTSNSWELTSAEERKAHLDVAAGQEASTFRWHYYSLHRTKRRLSSSALCSPQQRARCPCLCRKSDSCGRSRSLHRLTFHGSGHAGSLPWPEVGSGSPGPASQPLRPSTRPGIVLLALRSSLAPSGWMLQPQQQGLFLENLVLGCTVWPASKTTLNRRHLCFSEEKIKNITNRYVFLRCSIVLLRYFKQPLPSTAFGLLQLNLANSDGL